jgi:hypothetical protein
MQPQAIVISTLILSIISWHAVQAKLAVYRQHTVASLYCAGKCMCDIGLQCICVTFIDDLSKILKVLERYWFLTNFYHWKFHKT